MVNRASIKMVLKRLHLVFFLIISWGASGQFSQLDQNPFALKFFSMSMKKAPVDLLFPMGFDSVALATGRSIDANWEQIGKGFSYRNKRFKIVLQNQGLVSNGFVSLISPRAEFLTTSSQDPSLLGTNDWIPLLVSHESRHIHQNMAARAGFPDWVHGLLGSYGQTVYSNLLIPNWLWEGDAVETESRINPMGRSQIPQFKIPLKAYVAANGIPTYAKLMGKSFRDLVPNHYVVGQFLSQQMTKDFGVDFIPQLWESTLSHPSLFAFSKQFKKKSGLTIDQYARTKLSEFTPVKGSNQAANRGFTQYLYPNVLPDGRVIVLKTGFSDIKQLVERRDGKERILTYLGPLLDASMLSVSTDFVVWSEIVFDPRWGQKQRSRLVFYDLNSNQKSYWNPKDKWISPSISADSKLISIIRLDDKGQSFLRVYNRLERTLVAERKAMPGEQFLQPRICKNGNLIYIAKKAGNKSLVIWDFLNQKTAFTQDFGDHNIAHPFLQGDWIYLNYPNGEVDQIARLNINDQSFELVSDESWGAYSGIAHGDSLIYSAYKASGNEIRRIAIQPRKVSLVLHSHIVPVDSTKLDYAIKPFTKTNLLNPFTWGPLLSSSGNQLEYSVISRDVLNTLQAAAGIQYGMNEKQWTKFARLSYQAWYPILDLNVQMGDRKTQLYVDNQRPLDSLRTDDWSQTTWDVGVRLPFNLTHSAYQENLQLSSNIGVMQVRGYDLTKRYYAEPFNGDYRFMKHQFQYSKLLNRSLWDVQPRKGFVLQATWQGMPWKQTISNELWNFKAQVYLPGLFKHDGILLKYAYQQESEGNYRFSSSMFFPRGYLYTSFNRLSTMGIDYRFPIKNTDINIGRLIYITRLKGNVFADWGMGEDNLSPTRQSFQSFGVDLSAQFHALRFSEGFELGVRAMYLSASKSWAFVPLVIDIGF
jgi:hypothetical protein